jgi:hypothetical protein
MSWNGWPGPDPARSDKQHQERGDGSDPAVLDPWFLAGFLSSADGGRQAERLGSSLGGDVRVDSRRLGWPITLPLAGWRGGVDQTRADRLLAVGQ